MKLFLTAASGRVPGDAHYKVKISYFEDDGEMLCVTINKYVLSWLQKNVPCENLNFRVEILEWCLPESGFSVGVFGVAITV